MVRDYYSLRICRLLLCTFFTCLIHFSSRLTAPGLLSLTPHPILTRRKLPCQFTCTGSSSHLGISRLLPNISILHMGSSAHLVVTRLCRIISESPLTFPRCIISRPLLRVPLFLSPHIGLQRYSLQGCPDMCLQILLVPPCVPPAPSPLISCLPFSYLEYWPQIHPLFHHLLYASDVGCFQLSSRCFCNFLCP